MGSGFPWFAEAAENVGSYAGPALPGFPKSYGSARSWAAMSSIPRDLSTVVLLVERGRIRLQGEGADMLSVPIGTVIVAG